MLYRANFDFVSEKNAKHVNRVRLKVKLLIVKPVGALHNQ
jgi:hypothetical protein